MSVENLQQQIDGMKDDVLLAIQSGLENMVDELEVVKAEIRDLAGKNADGVIAQIEAFQEWANNPPVGSLDQAFTDCRNSF